MGRLFVTGFGPFGEFATNPSQILVDGLSGFERAILPVSYDSADKFAEAGLPRGHDRLLMVGVHGKADKMRVERIAKNWVGPHVDVEGRSRQVGRISDFDDRLVGELFRDWRHKTTAWKASTDAGSYLCNYLYFQATRLMPKVRTGFLHVPPFEFVDENTQRGWLRKILDKLEKQEANNAR
ncbi:MAG TPA: hypothetical protein VFG65_08560 [Fimbriimonadales bacterium]|nr:hypothetical protein [Fimbriimonadales bacterium]